MSNGLPPPGAPSLHDGGPAGCRGARRAGQGGHVRPWRTVDGAGRHNLRYDQPAVGLWLTLALALVAAVALVPQAGASFTDARGAVASFATADLFGPQWWDDGFGRRQAVLVTAGAAAVPAGYAVSLSLDHEALVSGGNALASGDDLRIAYWTGSEWLELDRVIDTGSAWAAADTTLWFATPAPIGADSTDGSYYLYYANPGAGAPPSDPGTVYLFHDDFSSGTLDRWDERTALPPSEPWYDAAWQWRKRVTIDAGGVEGPGPHADFPVLVRVTDADLQAHAQAGGNDIAFTAADGTTRLDHEIEAYRAASGELVAWVRVPSLPATSDTHLFLYYGNPDAPNQENAAGVWQGGFERVYHLNDVPDGSAGDVADSSASAFAGTSANMGAAQAAAGTIEGALDFDNTAEQRVAIGDPGADGWTAVTLSAWINPRADSNWNRVICRSPDVAVPTHIFCLLINGGRLEARVGTDQSDAFGVSSPTGTVSLNVWQHVSATWDATAGAVRVFHNGLQVASAAQPGATLRNSTVEAFIGNINATQDRYWNGRIDEARVASVARSQAWLRTEYNNQAVPADFATVSDPEAPPWSFVVATDQWRSAGHAARAVPTDTDRWMSAAGVDGQDDVLVDAWWRLSALEGMDIGQAVRTPAAGSPLQHYEGQLRWSNDPDRRLAIARYLDDAWSPVANPGPQPDHTAHTWHRMTVVIVGSRMRLLRDGQQIVPDAGFADVGLDIPAGGLGLRASSVDAGQAWWVDDVIARPYVDPEPTSELGHQQSP